MLPRTGWANSASRPCLPLAARAIAPRDTLRRDQKLPGRLMRKPPASKLLICSAVGARPNIRTLLRDAGHAAAASRAAMVSVAVCVSGDD